MRRPAGTHARQSGEVMDRSGRMHDDVVMTEVDGLPNLKRLKVRRERLAEAADVLEAAVTSAAGEPAAWRDEVRSAVTELQAALVDHVDVVEADGGLYSEIAGSSQRLLPMVERLRRDHRDLAERIDGLDALASASEIQVDALREGSLDLRTQISHHRHRGADLLWEHYNVDIGGF